MSAIIIKRVGRDEFVKTITREPGYRYLTFTRSSAEALRASEEETHLLCDYDITGEEYRPFAYTNHGGRPEFERVSVGGNS